MDGWELWGWWEFNGYRVVGVVAYRISRVMCRDVGMSIYVLREVALLLFVLVSVSWSICCTLLSVGYIGMEMTHSERGDYRLLIAF